MGIYSVSMVFDTGVSAFDFSDQNFGFNGGVGVLRRLSTNWSIDANATMNYFLVDKNDEDLYYAFTDGDDSPLLLDITVGLTLDLR